MIRILIILLSVVLFAVGYLLFMDPSVEHSRTATHPSKPVSISDSAIQTSPDISSSKSSSSHLRQTISGQIVQQSGDLMSGVRSTSTSFPLSSPKKSKNSSMAKPMLETPSSSELSYSQPSNAHSGSGGGGGSPREISISVPEGAKVPAVFFDAEEKPIAQQKALDRIAQEFEKNVSAIPAGLTKEEVWEAARSTADERYLTLFGYQAYNQYHIQSAKEALKEKQARFKATGP